MNDIKPKNTKTIDNKEFIESNEVDPALIERTYYIGQYTKRVAANKHIHSILFRVN